MTTRSANHSSYFFNKHHQQDQQYDCLLITIFSTLYSLSFPLRNSSYESALVSVYLNGTVLIARHHFHWCDIDFCLVCMYYMPPFQSISTIHLLFRSCYRLRYLVPLKHQHTFCLFTFVFIKIAPHKE